MPQAWNTPFTTAIGALWSRDPLWSNEKGDEISLRVPALL